MNNFFLHVFLLFRKWLTFQFTIPYDVLDKLFWSMSVFLEITNWSMEIAYWIMYV